jgi:hypothetical protein
VEQPEAADGMRLQPQSQHVVHLVQVLLERAVLVPALAGAAAVEELEQRRQRRIKRSVLVAQQRFGDAPLRVRDSRRGS